MDKQSIQSYMEQNQKTIAMGSRDKRSFERYNVSFKVHIKLSSGDVVIAQAKNISIGGIYIEYGAAADEGKEFELMFSLTNNEKIEPVFVRARVIRSLAVASRNVFGIALVFLMFHQESDATLKRFLEKYEKQYPGL